MPRVVVMGVSGAGKSTVGAALAAALGVPFVDGDGLHPAANVAKMAAGVPLDDDDRAPWLAAVREALAATPDVVVACSALRRAYRDVLRGAGGVRFVHLALPAAEAAARAAGRTGHYMGAGMVASQVATLEPPGPDEGDVAVVDATAPVAVVVGAAVGWLDASAAGGGDRETPTGRCVNRKGTVPS